jgi:hypothetical protein
MMQNILLARLRQQGVNYGSAPTNTATSYTPPTEVQILLNQKYNEIISRTCDYPLATIDIDFLTTANVNNYSLNPLPAGVSMPYGQAGANITQRPAILKVYEFRYFFGNAGGSSSLAQERYIPSLSSTQFRAFTGAYTQRLGAYAAYPRRVCQQYGLRRIDMFPGTATTADTIKLFACPDPASTEAAYPGIIAAAHGGGLTQPTDSPLIPPQFHMGIVYGASYELCAKADKIEQGKRDFELFEKCIEDMMDFGAANMEGEAEQRVQDPYVTAFDIDSAVL